MKITKQSRSTILRILAAAAPVTLFMPALITGKVLFWGTPVMQFIPWKYLAFESLRGGNLPLWNPFNGMGAPLLANYQLAFFYPPGWISYLFAAVGGISWLAWSETLLLALHLAWAAAGMMGFQKKMNTNLAGQLVSGVAFSMCGFMVARAGFFPIVIAAAWLPWIMKATITLAEQASKSARDGRALLKAWLFFWLCLTLQLLSGHAQITFYTIVLAGVWSIFLGFRGGRWKGMARILFLFIGGVVLSVMAAAMQLLPTMEYLVDSQRSANVEYSIAMVYSFWPWRFLTLLFPNFFGSPGLGNYWGYANFWEDAVYIGILPLAGAITTLKFLIKGRRDDPLLRDRSSILFFWCVVFVGFLLALGWNTPVFPFLYENVPTFDMFNGPSRFLVWVEFALAVLAGLGVAEWRKPKGRTLRFTRLAVAGSMAVSIGAILSIFYLKGVNVTFIPAAALAGILGAVTAVFLINSPSAGEKSPGIKWTTGVFLFVAVDLFIAGWKMNPFIESGFYQQGSSFRNSSLLPIQGSQRVFLTDESEYRLKFDYFFTFRSHFTPNDWGGVWSSNLPDTNIITGTGMVNNFDPLLPSRFAQMSGYLQTMDPDHLNGMLEFLGVTAIETVPKDQPAHPTIIPIKGKPLFRLYPCAEFVENREESWSKLIDSNNLETPMYFERVIIEKNGASNEETCSNETSGQLELRSHDPTRIDLSIESSQGVWLEAAETWYPGWVGIIDGVKTELYPSNYLFKAVYVPAGAHDVRLEYRPQSLYRGFVLSVVSYIIIGIVFSFSRKPGKGQNED